MEFRALILMVAGTLSKIVIATDVCSEGMEVYLQQPVAVEGLTYPRVQICKNGYIKFGQRESLTEPDELLKEDLSGAFFAPLLHDFNAINVVNVAHFERYPGHQDYDSAIGLFFADAPQHPDFNVDWYLSIMWVNSNSFIYNQFVFRLRMVQDNNYKNSNQSRLLVLFVYKDIDYFFENTGSSGQMPRAGVNAPFELPGSGTPELLNVLTSNVTNAPYGLGNGVWYFVIDQNDPDSALFNTTTPPSTTTTTTTTSTTTTTATTTSTTTTTTPSTTTTTTPSTTTTTTPSTSTATTPSTTTTSPTTTTTTATSTTIPWTTTTTPTTTTTQPITSTAQSRTTEKATSSSVQGILSMTVMFGALVVVFSFLS
ncbi:uncharacterized protein LOC142342042 isoform X2 [Convolutriloba macropyga]|uniref:uncharacterized protein LOC142342042 isoform X2 n=1 Tax=Convolutriloba macropyga TaxID=536237 RepID=UPI003F51C5E4